jgi:hypothetical protein
MDVVKLITDYLADPAHRAVVLYTLAVVFVAMALVFVLIGRRKKVVAMHRSVVMEDNNGIVITGDVRGGITSSVTTPRITSSVTTPRTGPAPKTPPALYWLNVLAAMSAIASAVFAAVAYLYPTGSP